MARHERTRERSARPPLPAGFGSVWTSVAVDLIGWGIVLPILPLYAERYTSSPFAIGVLVASFSVMQLVFAPVLGRLSDRVGRKPVLVVSLAGTAFGSLLMGLAPSFGVLLAGRIVDGISGGSVSAAQAAVSDMAPPEQRARLFGLLGAAFGVGFVAGPALGGLAALGGRHVPFFVAAAIAGVNAVVAWRRLPETNPSHAAPAEREPGAPRFGRLSHELQLLVLVGLAATSAFAAFESTFSLVGDERFSLGLAGVGALFAGIGICQALFQVGAIHPAVERWGEVGVLRIGLAANIAGFAVLIGADTWAVLVPGLLLVTAGQGLLSPALSALVSGRASADRTGAVLGIQQGAAAAARIVAPLVAIPLFGHVGAGAPYVAAAAMAAVALACTVGVRPVS